MSMWMLHSLLSLLFPPKCIGCGLSGVPLCARCIQLARKSLSKPNPYTISVFDFKDPLVKKAIHGMKYYHRTDLVTPLAEKLATELRTIPDIGTYVLVPIPMRKARYLIRGYNQASRIAEELGKMLSIPVRYTTLVRSKTTPHQAKTKTKEKRLANQKGSFELRESCAGMNILLIDDVTTTGATLDEARKTLLKGTATKVLAATLAH